MARRCLHVMVLFITTALRTEVGSMPDDVSLLSELPLHELLSQKKILLYDNSSLEMEHRSEVMPGALPLLGEKPTKRFDPLDHMQIKGIHRMPVKRGHYEEEEEEEDEGWWPKGKGKKSKIDDIFNTSVTALSFLAFGGYLLCLVVNAIREKKLEALSTAVTPTTQQLLLQQFLGNRPLAVRLPPSLSFQGRKKREIVGDPYGYYAPSNFSAEEDIPQHLMDVLQILTEQIVALNQNN